MQDDVQFDEPVADDQPRSQTKMASGTRPHQAITNVTLTPAGATPAAEPPGSHGLGAKFAPWANVAILTLFVFLYYQGQGDTRERDRVNSQRIDAWLAKSEERESRAWENRARDRESALKHGDEAVRQITSVMTQQTLEIGKMTKAIEALTTARP